MSNKISEEIKKKGFSILEVVISVAILSIGLVAAVGLIAGSIRDSIDSRDNIIAANLAQEGVELVRNVRDNGWLDGDPDEPFQPDFPSGGIRNECRIDKDATPSANPFACNFGNTYVLRYVGGYYVHSGVAANDTKFQRKISLDYFDDVGVAVDPDDNPAKATVKSIVIWGSVPFPADINLAAECTAGNKCIYIEDELTDWKI